MALDKFRTAATSNLVVLGIFVLAFVCFAYAWSVSYPLHSYNGASIFYSVSPVFWSAYLALGIGLWLLASRSRLNSAIVSVAFFTLMFLIGYFFYTFPGADQFFKDIAAPYFNQNGSIDPTVAYRYEWPGLFILTRIFSLVTMGSIQLFVPLFIFLNGMLFALAAFFVTRRPDSHPFWGVVAFTITGFFFLNYQFAAQTVGLALVVILFWREYTRWSTEETEVVLQTLLVIAIAFYHSFIGFLFVGYLIIRAVYDRRYLFRAILVAVVIISVDAMYTVLGFPNLVSFLGSFNLPGLLEYLQTTSASLAPGSPFQPLSRLCFAVVVIISAVGIVDMIKKRKLLKQDVSIIVCVMMFVVFGLAIPTVGTRVAQLAAIAAAIGGAQFPELLRIRGLLTRVLLIAIIVLSIFPVMAHNYQSLNYRTFEDTSSASFIASKLGSVNGRTLFAPFIIAGWGGAIFSSTVSRSLTFTESTVSWSNFSSTDYSRFDMALVTPSSFAIVEADARSNPRQAAALSTLISTGNRIFSYGDGSFYVSLTSS
jgi:hypothetical protein